MVSTISPVVYRSSDLGRKGWLIAGASYTFGSVVGGILAGGFFGFLGTLLGPLDVHQNLFPLFVGLIAIAYAMHELDLISLPYPQRRRQVPADWRYKFHPYMTAGLFGLLLGTGFITFIPTAAYYILAVAVTLYGSPTMGVFTFAIFGAGRASALWIFGGQNRESGDIERLTYHMNLTKPILHQVNGFALAMASAYLISVFL